MTKKIEVTGRLEAWCVDSLFTTVVWGSLYDDAKGRWRDGTRIHTSSIVSPPAEEWAEGVVIQTLNSTYLLGKPIVDGKVK